MKHRDVAGKTRRRLAAEQIADLVAVEKKTKELKGTGYRDRVSPDGPARRRARRGRPYLGDTGDVAGFADRNRFASWTGTAPLEASPGEVERHGLSRAGNRRMNHLIDIAAATQIRLDTEGRAYYRRKLTAGKSPREVMRCLKRRIADALYRRLRADARARVTTGVGAGPGGHSGASHDSNAAGSHPHTGTSDQPLPGPAATAVPAQSATRETLTSRLLEPAS